MAVNDIAARETNVHRRCAHPYVLEKTPCLRQESRARGVARHRSGAFLGVRDGQTIGFLQDTSRGRERPDALLCRRRMAVDVIDPEYRFVDYIEIHRLGT